MIQIVNKECPKEKMTKERAMELLNSIIDNFLVGENAITVIKHLLFLGFTKEELVRNFNFSLTDVEEAEKNMEQYKDTLIFV